MATKRTKEFLYLIRARNDAKRVVEDAKKDVKGFKSELSDNVKRGLGLVAAFTQIEVALGAVNVAGKLFTGNMEEAQKVIEALPLGLGPVARQIREIADTWLGTTEAVEANTRAIEANNQRRGDMLKNTQKVDETFREAIEERERIRLDFLGLDTAVDRERQKLREETEKKILDIQRRMGRLISKDARDRARETIDFLRENMSRRLAVIQKNQDEELRLEQKAAKEKRDALQKIEDARRKVELEKQRVHLEKMKKLHKDSLGKTSDLIFDAFQKNLRNAGKNLEADLAAIRRNFEKEMAEAEKIANNEERFRRIAALRANRVEDERAARRNQPTTSRSVSVEAAGPRANLGRTLTDAQADPVAQNTKRAADATEKQTKVIKDGFDALRRSIAESLQRTTGIAVSLR